VLHVHPPGRSDNAFKINFKLDTGASGNTIPLRILKEIYDCPDEIKENVQKEKVKLTAYNGLPIKYIGTMTMPIKRNDTWFETNFYVIDVENINYKVPAILGLATCEMLNLIQVNVDSITNNQSIQDIKSVDDLKKHYPKQFDTIGNMPGKVKIQLKPDATPYIAPPRKCPINLKEQIKEELDDMVKKGIIREISEQTDWVSNICFVTKKDKSLRICLDPKKLNDGIKRNPHKIPTVEELNPKFSGAKYFSKLDAKSGYWAVSLDEPSQLLTTFRSPLGQKYCFQRMPFGLKTSQDDFQRKMDENISDLTGVVSIADDVCVVGHTKEEHDANLVALMNRAAERGIVFNSKKCSIAKTSISFYGNVYSVEGIKPDPNKVQDIQSMPTPDDKDDMRRFLGMMTYLSQFIPNYSEKSALLRDLIKDKTVWLWEECHQIAFNNLKATVCEQSSLQYYNTNQM
jgi:hypothetical protein